MSRLVLQLALLLSPSAAAVTHAPIFPTTGLAVPIAAPASPAWGRAFDGFAAWLASPDSRRLVLDVDSRLVAISRVHPEARRIAVGPLAQRLPAELASSVERIAELPEAERREVYLAVSRARAQAAPEGEALALAAWERRKPETLDGDLGELRSLADQLKGMALYGETVRQAFRQAKRKYAERLMRSAGDASRRLLPGIDWDAEDFGSPLPSGARSGPTLASRMSALYAKPAASFYNPAHWQVRIVPDRRYARRLDAAADLFGELEANASPRDRGNRQSRERLLGTLRAKDPLIYSHLMRVGLMAGLIAWRMGMTLDYAQRAAWGARIHDIGKRDDDILAVVNKPGKLDADERKVMERHTTRGAEIVEDARELDPLSRRVGVRVARSHHETMDGKGYPRGLKEGEIPLDARIVAVADFFDALLENRPYRRGLTMEEALAIMEPQAPKFDPAVWRAFQSLIQPVPTPAASAAD